MRNSIVIKAEEHLEDMLDYAKEAGFGEVSISLSDPQIFLKPDYSADIAKIKEQLDQRGLVCGQTHLPSYHLLVSAENIEETMELAIKRGLEASALLGAKWTAYHPRSDIFNGFSRTKSFSTNREMLKNYLEYAEKYGVGIAVENMPLYPHTQADWRFFGGGWEELCELCDSLQSDKIGICWDFGHAHTAALDQATAIRDVGTRLKITHVHDNYRNGDHHLLPAMGDPQWKCIEWSGVMSAMRKINYTDALTLEVVYPPHSMCRNFMKLAYDSLEHLKTL